jgi:ABC-type branched-subunit amino acid transport system ATPase component/MFS family permease
MSAVRRWLQEVTGGAAVYPLVVLFGLNMVDELDRTALGVLLPEIRDHFGTDNQTILSVVSASLVGAIVLALPIGFYADRMPRVPIAAAGAVAWGAFSLLTGLAPTLLVLGIARAGSGLGRAVNDPVHNSLLADYYDIPVRPRVYSVHRYANAFGQLIGPVAAGLLAYYIGWRTPFVVFSAVTAAFVLLALRLREPGRGHFERKAAGASDTIVSIDEEPPSWAESWRIVWQVRTLRRVFYSLPFIAIAIVGLVLLSGLYYDEVFGLDERGRGLLTAVVEGGAQLVGLMAGIPLVTRLMNKGPAYVLRFLAVVACAVSVAWVVFAAAPVLAVAVVAEAVLAACLFLLVPGVFAVLSLTIPAKVRSFGFAVAAMWILPGLLLLPAIGAIGEAHGLRWGLLLAVPVFLVGALIIASAGSFVAQDVEKVWTSMAARSEVAHQRRLGQLKLLLVRGVDVHYDGVQVLFGVDMEVDEGEIVALLGTNGAGKSTLLRAVSGLVQASAGAVVFDGRDMTHTPPDEIAARGVTQVPGGQGVFTGLSVADNLRLAGWLQRRKPREVAEATQRVLETFPVLGERLPEPAGNLSGGQQQMLTLGMAFVGRPRLLMIDELSLGLAPTVVAQLLEMVHLLRARGTTIILVEQSVNVALTVAERAYFMEKGEVRFEGPTAELLERPDLLRSVFFSSAAALAAPGGDEAAPSTAASSLLGTGPPPMQGGPVPRTAGAGAGDGGNGGGGGAGRRNGHEPVLRVREVVKQFGGVRALDGVSFDVAPHEILGFVGPNGAGKTTLFDVLSGFVPADRGTIELHDDAAGGGGAFHELQGVPTHVRAWRGLGRSFQDGRLFPGLTVTETIAVALEQHVEVRDPLAACLRLPVVRDAEDDVADAVDELVELLGLGAYQDKFVHELSTGTRRIVDLACVLAQGPRVVLLDEPSSGIAQREAEALGPVLRRVRHELGASLLVIEHDLPLLRSLADRMIALDLGRVIAEGTPDEVIDHPEVVASYLGTDPSAIARSGAATS